MAQVTDGASGTPDPAGQPDPAESDERTVDPRAVRVEVAPALPIAAAGPWTVEPTTAAPTSAHVVTGEIDPPARDGTRRHEVVVDGWRFLLDVGSERAARLRARARRGREDAAHGGPLEVRAIIPGRVVAVSVAEGDTVEVGQQLLVIEAMKMQNELRSPRAGRVERLAAGPGQTVDLGTLLLVIA